MEKRFHAFLKRIGIGFSIFSIIILLITAEYPIGYEITAACISMARNIKRELNERMRENAVYDQMTSKWQP
jgi:hypothetical protein